ncbi:PucR family transcriptional regulator ligand-binding domain-containing protein [Paenibacillus sp. N1-5-1-14]|uniref:PucR family transcriptional regulator n=1 Tax=Paenibacillus radicibacter TaxID=2972488 RepID=UPI0021593D47|nr:PucR family transcriptional regulator [Paenibacillus radicibacter]MCR8644764.1 PucR family transcriptional regulator ligand-binding domain-containing protein [Paenibacillus radicibacter]
MELRVKDLFQIDTLKQAFVVSGNEGLHNQIRGVTIIEAPDIAEWINGGELLLTSLYPLQSYNYEEQQAFIERLAEKDVSALVVKTGRFVHDVPEGIIEASKRLRLPVIQIPKQIPYRDVMYPIMKSLFNKQVIKLKYFKEVHEKFTALTLTNKGSDEMIASLTKLIGNPATLYDRNFGSIATTDSRLVSFEQLEKEETDGVRMDTEFPCYRQRVVYPEKGVNVYNHYVIPIETINHIKIHLVIHETCKPVEPLDFIAIENAATALSLELIKHYAVAEVEMKFKDDLIDDLLHAKFDNLQNVYQRANVIGLDLSKSYAVVLFRLNNLKPTSSDSEMFGLHNPNQRILYEIIQQELASGMIRSRSDQLVVLWGMDPDADDKSACTHVIKKAAKQIQQVFLKRSPHFDVQVGIGNIAHTLSELPQSYKEAQDSLQLGTIIKGKNAVAAFSDLGIYRLLCQIQHTDELVDFIPLSLTKLLAYKQPNRDDLIKTLRTFLHHHQNAAKTAEELFCHYKTVTYRMDRIKEITGIDLDDPDEMLSVQVGLKILVLIGDKKESLQVDANMQPVVQV